MAAKKPSDTIAARTFKRIPSSMLASFRSAKNDPKRVRNHNHGPIRLRLKAFFYLQCSNQSGTTSKVPNNRWIEELCNAVRRILEWHSPVIARIQELTADGHGSFSTPADTTREAPNGAQGAAGTRAIPKRSRTAG